MTATPDVPPRIVGISDVLARTLELLDQYEGTDGQSPADDYDSEPRVHPMAEGKYILACVELAESGLLSRSVVRRRIDASLNRLEQTDALAGDLLSAWGLGFSFRDLPPAEPFTITTAIVLNALTRARPLLGGKNAARCRDMQSRTVRWLLDGLPRVEQDAAELPAYSPGLPVAANNVAAYWAGSLSKALPDRHPRHAEVRAVATRVLDNVIPDVGWTYERDSLRVDMVHTCYIGWGLLKALPELRSEIEPAVVCALLQFAGRTWTDRFDVYELDDAFAGDVPRAGRVTRVAGGKALVGFDNVARPWSVGESLVLLSTLAESERVSEFVYAESRALASIAVNDYVPERRYRHSTHLAHGLSMVVRTARDRNRNSLS